MEQQEISKSIRHFVKEHFIKGKNLKIDDDSSFIETGIIDSTGVMELVSFLEEKFNIIVDDMEIVPENLESTNRITNFVRSKLAGRVEA